MFKEILNSPMTPIAIGVKEKAVISNVVTTKGSSPYLIQVPRRYVEELFLIAIKKLKKAGVVPDGTYKTPRALAAVLTETQCEVIWNFIQPAPKGRQEPYSFENAEVTLRLKRKGDVDLDDNAVEMTEKIADLLNLSVKEIFIGAVDGVDADRSVAIERKRVSAIDVYGDDDFDADIYDNTTYTAEMLNNLSNDQLKAVMKKYGTLVKKGADGKVNKVETITALVGQPVI